MFGINWVYAGQAGTELQCFTFQWLKTWRFRKKLFLSKNQNDSTLQMSDHLNHHDFQYPDKYMQETRNQMKMGVRSLFDSESITFVIDQKWWRMREVWWLKLWRRLSFISWKDKIRGEKRKEVRSSNSFLIWKQNVHQERKKRVRISEWYLWIEVRCIVSQIIRTRTITNIARKLWNKIEIKRISS
jgi:hypothetical protein